MGDDNFRVRTIVNAEDQPVFFYADAEVFFFGRPILYRTWKSHQFDFRSWVLFHFHTAEHEFIFPGSEPDVLRRSPLLLEGHAGQWGVWGKG